MSELIDRNKLIDELFIHSIFEFAYADTPEAVTETARHAWISSHPLLDHPISPDKSSDSPLLNFTSLSDGKKMTFVKKMRKAIIEFVVPVMEEGLQVLAQRPIIYTQVGSLSSKRDLFEEVMVSYWGSKSGRKRIPVMALEALERMAHLKPGIKTCVQCDRLFFNTRRNVKFCGEKCRYRHYYLKSKKGKKK